jgi:hypothetical protein
MRIKCLSFLFCSLLVAGCDKDETTTAPVANEWTPLLDNNLSKWEEFIGVPHFSITTLPNHPKGDGMNGTPLGLGNDPLEVFKTETVGREVYLHISGEIYGGLTTKDEYGNYHLKLDFKWGEKVYEPRLGQKRDNGLLYHCYGKHGAFWNVWMNSQEFQVQEADMGDYFALGPAMDIRSSMRDKDGENTWIYEPGAPLNAFDGTVAGRCRRGENMEKPHGEWNTLELICFEDKAIHVVNGKVVMVLHNSRKRDANGNWEALKKGRIQIQSEAAEAWYRNIMIKPITEIPQQYKVAELQ